MTRPRPEPSRRGRSPRRGRPQAHRGGGRHRTARRPERRCHRLEPQPPIASDRCGGRHLGRDLDHASVPPLRRFPLGHGEPDRYRRSRHRGQHDDGEAPERPGLSMAVSTVHDRCQHAYRPEPAHGGAPPRDRREHHTQQRDAPHRHRERHEPEVSSPHTLTPSRRPATSFSPMPGTARRSSTEANRPFSSRQEMIRSASAGPIRGSVSNAA